jgi:hypothetical protein
VLARAIVCLLALGSFADVSRLSWQAPTHNVDGTPITVGIDHYDLYIGTTSGIYTESIEIPGTDLEYIHDMGAGDGVRRYYAISVTDGEGSESARSNEVSKLNAIDPTPEPATLSIETTAFAVILIDPLVAGGPGVISLQAVGTVPAGTLCDPGVSAKGHGVVPVSAVIWTSPTGPRPGVVVAQCDG